LAGLPGRREPSEDRLGVHHVLDGDHADVAGAGGEDLAGDGPDLLDDGPGGVVAFVDVVEDEEVGALILDLHAAGRGVEAEGVDDEPVGGTEPVAAPPFGVPVLVDVAVGEARVGDGHDVGLEHRGDGRDVFVGELLGR
jgi:hypothetical protein